MLYKYAFQFNFATLKLGNNFSTICLKIGALIEFQSFCVFSNTVQGHDDAPTSILQLVLRIALYIFLYKVVGRLFANTGSYYADSV